MNKKNIILIGKAIKYYSIGDEDIFFDWIKDIPSIVSLSGVYDELHMHIASSHIPDDDLREIIALFHRYKIDMKQLAIFLHEGNYKWFYGKPRGFWFKKIFKIYSPDKAIIDESAHQKGKKKRHPETGQVGYPNEKA